MERTVEVPVEVIKAVAVEKEDPAKSADIEATVETRSPLGCTLSLSVARRSR